MTDDQDSSKAASHRDDALKELSDKLANQMSVCIETSKLALGPDSHAPDVDFKNTFSVWIESALRQVRDESYDQGCRDQFSECETHQDISWNEAIEKAAEVFKFSLETLEELSKYGSPATIRELRLLTGYRDRIRALSKGDK